MKRSIPPGLSASCLQRPYTGTRPGTRWNLPGAAAASSDEVRRKTTSREPGESPRHSAAPRAEHDVLDTSPRVTRHYLPILHLHLHLPILHSGEGRRQHFPSTAARRRPLPSSWSCSKTQARGDSCSALAIYRHAYNWENTLSKSSSSLPRPQW